MPAIKKISKEAIIDAAVDVLREGGAAAINARSVAKELGCSTQPIYLSFQNMDDLKAAMTQRAVALHTRHVRNSNSDTQYLWKRKPPRTTRLPSVSLKSAALCRTEQRAMKARASCWKVRSPTGLPSICCSV